jgi:hypothetical protein
MMGAAKELWFANMERRMAELIDQGMSEDEAYEKAANQVYHELGDRMADMADNIRKQTKENGK